MPTTNADTFKATLQQIEQSKDPAAMVALFHDDATVDTPAHERKLSGRDAITQFWKEYLHAFGTIHSTFTTDHTIGDTSVMQWVSTGTLPNDQPIRYRGVSIVTFKGYKVMTFTAYYDSAAFLAPPPEKVAKLVAATSPAASGLTNNEGGD
ncbi:MAG TPA: nuclear transport factor 2 family protein [Tepidisphaeraceae bacterium]|jgi:ketosteroid isomerase-like protein